MSEWELRGDKSTIRGRKQVFEPVLDGRSVIIWEGIRGTRIIYWTDKQAEGIWRYLQDRSNEFRTAREENKGEEDETMVTITMYSKLFEFGEPVTEWEFLRRFFDAAVKRFEVEAGLEREPGESW